MRTIQQSAHGLILSSDRNRLGLHDSAYQRAALRGELVRVRRGAYCDAKEWAELSSRQRYLLRMRAVMASSARQLVFCSYSAAAVWGMPIPGDWPTDVHVVSSVATGGRSRNGVVRHPIAHAVAHFAEHQGFSVTDVAGTAVDLALTLPFSLAVGCVDWALWRRNALRVTVEELRGELERRGPRYGRRQAEVVLDFATGLSDSFGESQARAVMHELGFPVPELQVRFSDRQGDMFPDYFWPGPRVAGEFDGKSKYLRPAYGPQLTPGEIVWQEKKRQDRLRKQVSSVVRVVMADVMNPDRLSEMLLDAGVQRR